MSIDYSQFPFAKPGPKARSRISVNRHKAEKAAKRKTQREVIALVRDEVFQQDRVCAVCRKPGKADDEMHEIVPRSKTRGLEPEQRFNVGNCIRLHSACHRAVTEHRVQLEFLMRELGMESGLLVSPRGKEPHIYWRDFDMAQTTTKPTTAAVKKPMTPATKKPATKGK